jgi:hypothetical protein
VTQHSRETERGEREGYGLVIIGRRQEGRKEERCVEERVGNGLRSGQGGEGGGEGEDRIYKFHTSDNLVRRGGDSGD